MDISRLLIIRTSALGDIGPAAKSALPALQEATKDEIPAVRDAALAAIDKIQR